MGRVVSPIVLSLVYLIGVFPTSLIVRYISENGFKKYKSNELESYWIVREQDHSSFDRQF